MRRVFWIVPLVVLLGLIGWRVTQKNAKEAGPGGPQAAGGGRPGGGPGGGGGRGGPGGPGGGPAAVEAEKAGPRTMETLVQAVGTAASPQTVRLSPPTSGRITFIQAREGDRVTAGETLVRIDPTQIEGTVLQGIAGVSEAQARLAQAQATIGASDVSIESAIRTQRAAVASAQASLAQAKRTQAAQIAAAQAVVTQQAAAAQAAQASVASAQASEEAAKGTLQANQTRLTRLTGLFEGGFIAAQDVDDAKAQVATALGQVRVAQQSAASARAQVAQANAQKAAAQAQVVVAQRETQGAILTAQAQLRTAQAALESAIANRAQAPANRRNIEALQASVRAAQGTLDAAQAQRANTELKSTIDGTVTARAADVGTLAQPGTPVLTVQVLKTMFVESSYPVELAPQIKPGMTAKVTFDALPDRQFTGRITDLNRAADPLSRQFTVRVLLQNGDEAIRPGMFGQVRVVTNRADVPVAVPLNALTEAEGGNPTVAVVGKDGTVNIREVTVGRRDEESVEIVKGVQAGESVVTTRGRALRDGQKVSVNDPNAKGGGRRKK